MAAFRVPFTPGTEWFELGVVHACVAISRMLFSEAAPHRPRRASDDEADTAEPGE